MEYNYFKFLHHIGTGSKGKVYLVENKKTGELMAMKSISKNFIIENDAIQYILLEKLIMEQIDSPFIIKLKSIFVLPERVYFLMNYIK